MKKVRFYVTVAALTLALSAIGLLPANAANYLEGIGVTRSGDSIVVSVSTTADCEYNAFLTESKPERIVIDLTGVVNNLEDKQFLDLPLRSIKSIRTSQFKSDPEAQARVVLDINRPIDFRNYKSGNTVVIKFPSVPDEIEFTRWESSASDDIIAPPVERPVEQVATPPVVEPPTERPVEQVAAPLVVEPPTERPVEQAVTPAVVEPPAEQPVEQAVTTVEESVADNQIEEDVNPIEEPAEDPEEYAEVEYDDSSDNDPITPAQLAVSDPVTAPGVQVDTTPKRKTIEYTASSLRDPFAPLIGLGAGKIIEGFPSLENLKLVGILENYDLNRALLEDGEGNGYMLKPNDRVQNGYLVTVTESKAVFQVTEYGWTRTVSLELEIPEIK